MRCLYFVSLLMLIIVSQAIEEYSLLGECDDASVPYKIEINQNGRPELYCTSSTFCFGKDFHSSCSGFHDKSCYEPNEWLGGMMELNTGSNIKLTSKCCSYPELEHSARLKTFSLGPNDAFTGGVFISNKGIEGFDLIKEVRRIGNQERLSYEIMVVRMPCNVDVNEEYDLLKRMGYLPEKPRLRRRFGRLFSRRGNFLNDYYDDFYGGQSETRGDPLYRNQIPLVLVEQDDKVFSPVYSSLPADSQFPDQLGQILSTDQNPTLPIQSLPAPTVPLLIETPPPSSTSSPSITKESTTEISSSSPSTALLSSTTEEEKTTVIVTSPSTIKPTATLKNGKVKINKFMVPKRIQFKRDLKKHSMKKESSSEEAISDLFDDIARV